MPLNLYKWTFVQLFGLNLSSFGQSGRVARGYFLSRFAQIFWVLTRLAIGCRLWTITVCIHVLGWGQWQLVYIAGVNFIPCDLQSIVLPSVGLKHGAKSINQTPGLC